jgi:AcrR family transcriptional regulator
LSQLAETKEKSKRERLRERLLDAAEAVITQDGLAALKARDLAARVGCALGGIYTVFEDLDDLILFVGARTMTRLEAALANGSAPDGGSELQRLALAYLRYARAEGPRWRALFEHRLPAGKPLPDWYASQRDRLFNRLEEPLSRLTPKATPADLALHARTLFSAVHGIVLLGLEEKLVDESARTLETELSYFVEVFAAGLSAGQTPSDQTD